MIKAFLDLCTQRGFTPDEAQMVAASRLQKLHDDLVAFKHKRRTKLRKLFINPALPRGVFFWGGVGRGKSLLMDSFYASLPYKRKRRVHFHAFMRETHEQLKKHKQQSDPLMAVADDIAKSTRVLCFDEFHVSDIADAMILGRLYTALSERGVVFCMTSNYPPDGLYPNGLQRQNFLPTIKLLKQNLDVIEVDAGIDYRRRALEQMEIYLVPSDASAQNKMEQDFAALCGGEGHSRPILIQERELPVIRRSPGAIWFDFATLCGGPRSQNDYLELAQHFQTVLLSDVPKMTREMASEARRFTWLIDVFYDHRVKLILSAACRAEDLYLEGPQASEFQRTVSRLTEMRSQDYLTEPHRLILETSV